MYTYMCECVCACVCACVYIVRVCVCVCVKLVVIIFFCLFVSFAIGHADDDGDYGVISTLTFHNVAREDTGSYRCSASNVNGSSHTAVNLLLYGEGKVLSNDYNYLNSLSACVHN